MERDCEEGEMETKLTRGLLMGHCSKRAAPSTPPPTWRLGDFSAVVDRKEFLAKPVVSVRELCADLWEIEQFRPLNSRRRSQRRDSPCDSPLQKHQPPSRGSLRKQITTRLVSTEDHRLLHRNDHLLQPVSPSSCSNSSLEVVVRKPAFSQTASSMAKSTRYGLGSSTKLLKVLNRIWNLEAQNTANASLVKALRLELDECRAEIKEVKQREKQIYRRVRKETEEELKDVFRSLDEERKLRKQSESLHRKLTRELSEAKHCLSKALKDLEKERKERVVVENLCDEFAKSVRDYEDKVRRIGNKSQVSDKVIVEIAEVWNDQRLQTKLEEKRRSHSRDCLKELEEELEKRNRRDNRLQLKKKSFDQVLNQSMSSEGDKIHPESSPRNFNGHESLEKSKILLRNVTMREDSHRSLKDKLMEARVESRRLRSLKPESSPSHSVQG